MYVSSECLNLLQASVDIFSVLCRATLVIFNADGYRIAASDHFKAKINDWGPENYPSLTCMRKKERIYIAKPVEDPACRECIYTTVCDKQSALHIPLLRDERVFGAIAVLWYCHAIPEQYDTHLQYLEQMATSLLHSDALHDMDYQRNFSTANQKDGLRFSALGNLVQEGVILLDSNSCIREINDRAAWMAGKPKYSLIGKHIGTSFSELPPFGSAEQLREPVLVHSGNKGYNLRCSTRYLGQADARTALLIVFEVLDVVEDAQQPVNRLTFENILGRSRALRTVLDVAKKVAKTESTILIRGESGTGKELVAQAIHHTSMRAQGPFVAINCSAIPDELMESELFGYEPGTFTGALKGGKDGLIQNANGGTIFLDEIGDMSFHLQAKLLRVLEGKKIKRLGSSIELPVDIRIVAATNQDLEQMVEENRFRRDLFYRLNVIPLILPPLRERKADIEELVDHFISVYGKKNAKGIRGYMPGVLKLFREYNWPGNVRELQNVIEYAVNVETAEYLSVETVSLRFPKPFLHQEAGDALHKAEKDVILGMLEEYGYNAAGKHRAAKELGISLSTLYRKLRN